MKRCPKPTPAARACIAAKIRKQAHEARGRRRGMRQRIAIAYSVCKKRFKSIPAKSCRRS